MSAIPLRLPARVLLLATTLALLPAPALAQGVSGGDIAEIVRIQVRDGHRYEFEEGVKRHQAMSMEQGNPSAWLVWEVITGTRTGQYVAGTFGHAWADFDVMPDDPQAMDRSFMQNIRAHVTKAEVSFWTLRQDLSASPPGEGPPPPFLQVYHFMPTSAGVPVAEETFGRVVAAAEAAQWPGATWSVHQLVNGGPSPHYAVAIPAESFADMEEPSPNMYEMLIEQMGEDETNEMFGAFSAALRGEDSEIFVFRPDLSSIPDGGM
ncbi:MAG: hypothetical protein PVI57_04055 [Gemmatimonadota bacterium]|jgi:hypothetical protein